MSEGGPRVGNFGGGMCEGSRYWVDIGHFKKEHVAIWFMGNPRSPNKLRSTLCMCHFIFSLEWRPRSLRIEINATIKMLNYIAIAWSSLLRREKSCLFRLGSVCVIKRRLSEKFLFRTTTKQWHTHTQLPYMYHCIGLNHVGTKRYALNSSKNVAHSAI